MLNPRINSECNHLTEKMAERAFHQNDKMTLCLKHLKTRSLLISLSALNINLNSLTSGDIVKIVKMVLDENLEL